MDQQFRNARVRGMELIERAADLTHDTTEALWTAYFSRYLAAVWLRDEQRTMATEYERLGVAFVHSSTDHVFARLVQAHEPLVEALKMLIGEETYAAELEHRYFEMVENA